jgi:phage tail sheath protein FI
MGFLVSPGVHVREIDLTNVIPAVSTSIGAIAGPFAKGPVSSVTAINSEEQLLQTFGKPNGSNFEWWFTAANFLQYGDALRVVRAESAVLNAGANSGILIRDDDHYEASFSTGQGSHGEWSARTAGTWGNSIGVDICPSGRAFSQQLGSLNLVDGAGAIGDLSITVDDQNATDASIIIGDIIQFYDASAIVSVVNGAITVASKTLTVDGGTGALAAGQRVLGAGISDGDVVVKITSVTSQSGSAGSVIGVVVLDKAITVADNVALVLSAAAGHDRVESGNVEYEVTAISSEDLTIRVLDDPAGAGLQTIIPDNSLIRRRWRFSDLFLDAPGTSDWAIANARGELDEMHIAVYDKTGDITGKDVDVKGQRTAAVIETYSGVSKNSAAKTTQGGNNYYPDVIFRESNYIYWTDHISAGTNWGTDVATGTDYTIVSGVSVDTLTGGTDDYSVTAGEVEVAYDKFADTELLDINLIMGGPSSGVADTEAGQDTFVTMITDLVELRRDCVGFVSPYRAAVVGVTSSITATENVKDAFNKCPSSSYMVFDSGYKYMYDKYSDVYRFVPLNGDTAGLCAYTDGVADPWFSPAGYNRGNVRSAIKLAYNPMKADRDILYKARINPVVDFPGQGVTLFGDKTALSKPSAFDRINVRRLFLVLEKAIATASKYMLFEFNDEFTRAQFRNMVEPFLRDVQGRRGIFDFKVVCDSTNNTGEVIDRNEFIGDIYIKPARSINFITLNFIAVRTGVAFSEVGG